MGATEQDIDVDEEDREILRELLELYRKGPALPEVTPFRVAHADARKRLDRLEKEALITRLNNRYYLTLFGLLALRSPPAKIAHQRCREILSDLQSAYLESPGRAWTAEQFGERFQRSEQEVSRILTLLKDTHGLGPIPNPKTGFLAGFSLTEGILDTALPDWPEETIAEEISSDAEIEPRIERIEISGYRPFSGFAASPAQLTVIIGANAAGKSSLFDAMRLLSYAAENPLPPEIDLRSEAASALFHAGGPERIDLAITAHLGQKKPLRYEVSIQGPVGAPRVARERLATTEPVREGERNPFVFLDFLGGKGVVRNARERALKRPEWSVPPNELALRRALDPTLVTLSRFQAFVASWRSYPGFDVSPRAAMRRPAYTEERPLLAEDGSNLSAVLNSLILEHRDSWEEIETHLRAAIPGFESLKVRPRGGRGMAIGVWRERGVKEELTLGDLSEGTLRLLCWLVLTLSPNLPPVVCIDEPELGLHPRVLPTLAGAFKLASARSQILIATHSPHFLSQFDLDEIAVMRKDDGRAVFVRPGTSQALRREVEEIGGEALARLFISEELEVLP
jgi:predicted ATPase